MRFVGQRMAAVVAESLVIAEKACRRNRRSNTKSCPRCSSRRPRVAPGRPDPRGQGRPMPGSPARATSSPSCTAVSAMSRRRARRGGRATRHPRPLPHPPCPARTPGDTRRHRLEGDDGPLGFVPAQVPFLVRDELGRVFGLRADDVQVFSKRVGGGFGGKQEVLTEDVVALAALRLGWPVRSSPAAPRSSPSHQPTPVQHRSQRRRQQRGEADGAGVEVLIDAGRLREP